MPIQQTNHKLLRSGDPPYADTPEPGLVAQLRAFADAVRKKERWYVKILKQSGLAGKWANEAKLPEHADVSNVIRELKYEARRIYFFDHSIQLALPHLPQRPVDWEAIKTAVEKADAYLRTSKYGIDAPRFYDDVGAYFADDVVPEMLHRELVHELDALAAMEPKDFHPGAGCKVQDLIHPSLYPLMADITPLPPTVKQPPTQYGQFATSMREKYKDQNDLIFMKSAFAWIPTVFAVSENGKDVSIEGYINGLGSREQYPTLFKSVEEVFKVAMPILERTLSFNFKPATKSDPALTRFWNRYDFDGRQKGARKLWDDMLEQQKVQRESAAEERALQDKQKAQEKGEEKDQYRKGERQEVPLASTMWAGKKLKVVVKAANYILEPGQEYAGTWHMEGMPHERIVASAIYYYERDSTIMDAGLYLRRKRDGDADWPAAGRLGAQTANYYDFNLYIGSREDNEPGDYSGTYDEENYARNNPSDYGSDTPMENLPAYMNIGVMPTINEYGEHGTGRIITFPNWVQHRVMSVFNDPSANSTAIRKILCFFLVDDSNQSDVLDFPGFYYDEMNGMQVLTSCDVPSQARPCNLPTLGFLLPIVCRQVTRGRRTLPPELVDMILAEMQDGVEFGMTRENAEVRRRELMTDRKVQAKNINGFWETEYSLCEH